MSDNNPSHIVYLTDDYKDEEPKESNSGKAVLHAFRVAKRMFKKIFSFKPHMSGVVRTLTNTKLELENRNHLVTVIHADPKKFYRAPLLAFAGHPEIPIAVLPKSKKSTVANQIDELLKQQELPGHGPVQFYNATPESFVLPPFLERHISLGIGRAAMRHCRENNIKILTGFHTDYPKFTVKALHRSGVFKALQKIAPSAAEKIEPVIMKYGDMYMRYAHRGSSGIMTPPGIIPELIERGYDGQKLIPFPRGVNTTMFRPNRPGDESHVYDHLPPGQIFVYFGRIAPEKNVERFLEAKSKIRILDEKGDPVPVHFAVIGDGPMLDDLKNRYKESDGYYFFGRREGNELVDCIRGRGKMVAVLPMNAETFGNVYLEALACGVPVVTVPSGAGEYVVKPHIGVIDADVAKGCEAGYALAQRPGTQEACRRYILDGDFNGWGGVAQILEHNLVNAREPVRGQRAQKGSAGASASC